MSYQCVACGQVHDDLPDIGVAQPDQYWDVPEEKRAQRIALTADTCEIDGAYFFVRGVLEIPVEHHPQGLGFGVWVSLSKENFRAYEAQPDSAGLGPFFGWLCTRIACFGEDTQLLKTRVKFPGNGLRPLIELEPTGHALSLAQQQGVSLEQAWRYVHFYDTD